MNTYLFTKKSMSFLSLALFMYFFPSKASLAYKTNQAVYQDIFDLAAGGTNLTRASRDAILFSNPSLLYLSDSWIRWIGMQTTIYAGQDSTDFLSNLASGQASEGEGEGEAADSAALFNSLFQTPIHAGLSQNFSVLTKAFGITALASMQPDIRAFRHGTTGLPGFKLGMDAYGGTSMGMAFPLTRRLVGGLNVKYLYKIESEIEYSLADSEQIEALQNNPQETLSEFTPGQGLGVDAAITYFGQGAFFDTMIVLKVDDIGGTEFTGGGQRPFRQLLHAGYSHIFHVFDSSLQWSLDYRDILGVYEEELGKRLYTGLRLTLSNDLGLAAGLYQGYLSYGLRLNAKLLKIGFTSYTKEMGQSLGEDPRSIYAAEISVGF